MGLVVGLGSGEIDEYECWFYNEQDSNEARRYADYVGQLRSVFHDQQAIDVGENRSGVYDCVEFTEYQILDS